MNYKYLSYLRSKDWKEKREVFLNFANHECQECGSNKNLQVYHISYNNIYDETEDDVEVLCKECHEDKELEKGTDLHNDAEYGEW